MQKAHKEAHPVELALIVALAVGEAITVLVVTLLALARWSPAAPPEPSPMAPPPAAHPLALVAEQLQALPQRQLMALAGTRRKLPKGQLIGMVIACS